MESPLLLDLFHYEQPFLCDVLIHPSCFHFASGLNSCCTSSHDRILNFYSERSHTYMLFSLFSCNTVENTALMLLSFITHCYKTIIGLKCCITNHVYFLSKYFNNYPN